MLYLTLYMIFSGLSSPSLALAVINRLHPIHQNVFCYIVSFLRELLLHKNENGLSVETLSGIFASVMIKPAQKATLYESLKRKRVQFFEMFLDEQNPIELGQMGK